MPRTTTKVKPVTPHSSPFADLPLAIQPLPPSEIVASLRRDYRWAAISQFLWTFGEGVGLIDWDIEMLEREFDSEAVRLGQGEDVLIVEVITKLLYALTYDRTVNKSNFEEKLRNQYLKREPKRNPLGVDKKDGEVGEIRRWNELGVFEKVGAIHDLCEWQFSDPMRFRALLKSEEDAVSWRIEPCGWDRNGNIYWLFDDNRLWVQHPSPLEPKAARTIKVKSSSKSSKQSKTPKSNRPTNKPSTSHRKKKGVYEVEIDDDEEDVPRKSIFDVDLVTFSGRGRTRSAANPPPPTTTTKNTPINSSRRNTRRSAVEPPVFASPSTRTRGKRPAPEPETEEEKEEEQEDQVAISNKRTKLATSTRSSRRTRDEEVWQEIPPEWLDPNAGSIKPTRSSKRWNGVKMNGKGKARKPEEKVVKWSDIEGSDSELSELSESPERTDEKMEVPAGDEGMEVPAEDEGMNEEQREASETGEIAPSTPAPHEEADPVDSTTPPEETQVKPELAAVPNGELQTSPIVDAESPADEKQPSSESGVGKQENAIPAAEDSTSVPKPSDADEKPDTADKKTNDEVVLDETQMKVDEADEEDETDEVKIAAKKARTQTWLEWEAVCVSRYDWENFPKQFVGSKHVDEKAFYSYLVDSICPGVIAVLREKEVELAKQEAIRNRKRSSRILMKELERDEQVKREQAQRDMEERMQRVRDQEAKAAAEEAARIAADHDREHRMREREERIRQREEAAMERALEESRAKEKAERDRERRLRRREQGLISEDESTSTTPAPRSAQTPAAVKHLTLKIKKPLPESSAASSSDNWELACEVCKQHGWNLDDDTPLACCEGCGRWQHIDCHDRKDDLAGNRRRDWDNVDFYCADCRRRMARERQLAAQQRQASSRASAPEQHAGYPPSQGMLANGAHHPQSQKPSNPPSHGMVANRPPMLQRQSQDRYPANGMASTAPRTVYTQPQAVAASAPGVAQGRFHPAHPAGPPRQMSSAEAPQHPAMSYPAQQQYPPPSQAWQQRAWPQNGPPPAGAPHYAPSPRPTSASPHSQSPHSIAASPQQRTLPSPSPSTQYTSLSPGQQYAVPYRQSPQQPQARPLPQNGAPPQQWQGPPGGQYQQHPQYQQARPPQHAMQSHMPQQHQHPGLHSQAPTRPPYAPIQQHYGPPPSGSPHSNVAQRPPQYPGPPQSRLSASPVANHASPYHHAAPGYGQYQGMPTNGAPVYQGHGGYRPPSVAMPLQPQNNPPRHG